ncbi:WD40 repeat-like protein [Dendrothele bispora CBS 962.96]|uniref:WD40 repeat-like protein n=1 Tax=Dendrothele bispora (strain CBS 962.96) TaxID=1314807 RepID=A0A4S8M7Z8_DENBC|nr:WD40 repeat-like protein [Dendrothele bispora CBS 962.96]
MPDSFFTSTKPRKRKRSDAGPSGSSKLARKASSKSTKHEKPFSTKNNVKGVTSKKKRRDEELESDQTDEDEGGIDDMDLRADSDEEVESGDDDPDETPAEKRLRLAQLYLDSVKQDIGLAEGEFDAAEIDRELISARLKQDVMEHSGKVHLFVANSFDFSQPPKSLRTKGHRFSVTSAVASESGKYLFTSGKEGHIFKWDLSTGKKLTTLYKLRPPPGKGKGKALDTESKGHTDEVLALALSSDGRYLASGGKDRKVGVWDAEKGEWIKGFVGPMCHKDTVSSLTFRKATHTLYTASFDRTLKVFDLSPNVMGYVETLFGHQDTAVSIDSLRAETCVSVGARDKTARFWKIVDESQLVFRGGGKSKIREVLEGGLSRLDDEEDGAEREKENDVKKRFAEGSLECIAMIDESTFVTGGDSGSISLWSTSKKKPVFTQGVAHGLHEVPSETSGVIQTPRWITSIASLRYSDLFASGSWEGSIRLWQLDSKLKSFSLVGTIPAPGIVNSLQFVTPPKDFFDRATWINSTTTTTTSLSTQDTENVEQQRHINGAKDAGTVNPVLLTAGLGQEPKFGRWLTLKEGASNGAMVFALMPQTS